MIKNKAPKANVAVLYNAVNTYPQNPYNKDARNVLFLGRLGERNGTFDLLKAIKALDKDIDNNIKFYLCSDGAAEKEKECIKDFGIEYRIAYVGWIDGGQKQEFIKKTMINVLPSYNEGLPMSILETMAAGIPNISTRIASIPEVLVDGENGYMITPGDVDALVDRLRTLINDSALRQKFSEAGYELVTRDFSLSSNIEKLKSIYKGLL